MRIKSDGEYKNTQHKIWGIVNALSMLAFFKYKYSPQ